jgi:hypothetical protein
MGLVRPVTVPYNEDEGDARSFPHRLHPHIRNGHRSRVWLEESVWWHKTAQSGGGLGLYRLRRVVRLGGSSIAAVVRRREKELDRPRCRILSAPPNFGQSVIVAPS